MSGLKKFLDKRVEGLAREEAKKNKGNNKETPIKKAPIEENPNLTDDEFWAISNQFISERRNSENPVEVLQHILETYTPLKIKQFAKRFEELNK